MRKMLEVTVITKEKDGTGRYRDSVARGTVCPEDVSTSRQYHHPELGICTIVVLRNGYEVKVRGSIDFLLQGDGTEEIET